MVAWGYTGFYKWSKYIIFIQYSACRTERLPYKGAFYEIFAFIYKFTQHEVTLI